LDSLFFLIAL